jgi:hypothetical protein
MQRRTKKLTPKNQRVFRLSASQQPWLINAIICGHSKFNVIRFSIEESVLGLWAAFAKCGLSDSPMRAGTRTIIPLRLCKVVELLGAVMLPTVRFVGSRAIDKSPTARTRSEAMTDRRSGFDGHRTAGQR